jgi:hypothetical protein
MDFLCLLPAPSFGLLGNKVLCPGGLMNLTDQLHGRTLTPDGLRIICASFDYAPEQIGQHMLDMLAKFRSEGIVQ